MSVASARPGKPWHIDRWSRSTPGQHGRERRMIDAALETWSEGAGRGAHQAWSQIGATLFPDWLLRLRHFSRSRIIRACHGYKDGREVGVRSPRFSKASAVVDEQDQRLCGCQRNWWEEEIISWCSELDAELEPHVPLPYPGGTRRRSPQVMMPFHMNRPRTANADANAHNLSTPARRSDGAAVYPGVQASKLQRRQLPAPVLPGAWAMRDWPARTGDHRSVAADTPFRPGIGRHRCARRGKTGGSAAACPCC